MGRFTIPAGLVAARDETGGALDILPGPVAAKDDTMGASEIPSGPVAAWANTVGPALAHQLDMFHIGCIWQSKDQVQWCSVTVYTSFWLAVVSMCIECIY